MSFLGNLFTPSSDPIGLQSAINDGTTLTGNILGENGVVDDLFGHGEGSVDAVLKDVVGDGGIINNLAEGGGTGLEYLVQPGTVLGGVVGDGSPVDDLLG